MRGDVRMLVSFFSMLLFPPLMVFIMRWLGGKFGGAKPVVALYFLLSASWIALGLIGLTVGPPWLSPLWLLQGIVGLAIAFVFAYARKAAYLVGALLAILGLRAVITSGILPVISAALSACTMLCLAYTADLPEIRLKHMKRAAVGVFAAAILLMLPFPFGKPTVLKMSATYKLSRMEKYWERTEAKEAADLKPLLNALNDLDGLVRAQAVRHLGSLGEAGKDADNGYLGAIIDALILMIDDVETRADAILQLIDIGDARAVRPLIDVIRKYPDVDKYPDKAMFEAFGGFAAQLMIELLEDTTGAEQQDIRVRRRLIIALGSYQDRRVAEAIAMYLEDKNGDVRVSARESLEKMRKSDVAEMPAPGM